MWIRAVLKRAAEHALASRPALWPRRRRARGRSVILAYHNVVPDDEPLTGERRVHLCLSGFARQLDLISDVAEVIPLEKVLEPPSEKEHERLRVAITFDDAYRGALRVAVPELARRGIPATVFVPTGLLGRDAFWWDALELSDEGRAIQCLDRLGGRLDDVLAWGQGEGMGLRVQAPNQRPGTVEDLSIAAGSGCITFAPHSRTHPNFSVIPRIEIQDELRESREWMRSSGLPYVDWFSYPYGLTSQDAEEVCRASGMSAAVLACGGWIPARDVDRFRVPRITVSDGKNLENFLLRLFGVLPS